MYVVRRENVEHNRKICCRSDVEKFEERLSVDRQQTLIQIDQITINSLFFSFRVRARSFEQSAENIGGQLQALALSKCFSKHNFGNLFTLIKIYQHFNVQSSFD